MSLQNNKFLVSACVFPLVISLGTNINFAMKEKDNSSDNVTSNIEDNSNDGKENEDLVQRNEAKMTKELNRYNNGLSTIFEEKQDVEESSKNNKLNVLDEEKLSEEINHFLNNSVPENLHFSQGGADHKSLKEIFTKTKGFKSGNIKISKVYKEDDEGHQSAPEPKMKFDSQKIFLEDEFQKDKFKFSKDDIGQENYNSGKPVDKFFTPEKKKGKNSDSYAKVYRGTYTKDQENSPCGTVKELNFNEITPSNGYKGNESNIIKVNDFLLSPKRENFYDHFRKIFAEHPSYKYYVVVAAIGVIVFKEAFDL